MLGGGNPKGGGGLRVKISGKQIVVKGGKGEVAGNLTTFLRTVAVVECRRTRGKEPI